MFTVAESQLILLMLTLRIASSKRLRDGFGRHLSAICSSNEKK